MIVWRGKGWWTLIILWACLYLIPGVWHTQQGRTWAQATRLHLHDLSFVVGLLTAGVILTAWGLFLNRRPARQVMEPQTGRTYMARPSHSFYYLNMEYWGAAALLGGIVMFVRAR